MQAVSTNSVKNTPIALSFNSIGEGLVLEIPRNANSDFLSIGMHTPLLTTSCCGGCKTSPFPGHQVFVGGKQGSFAPLLVQAFPLTGSFKDIPTGERTLPRHCFSLIVICNKCLRVVNQFYSLFF